MALSITGGSFKGRKIAFSGGHTRPTSARVRQALFDILGDVGGLRFCDLYAGSGAVGIEAASRGAGYIEFVEADRRIARGIIGNLRDLDLAPETARVRSMRVEDWAKRSGESFDLIFADPPYTDAAMDKIDSVYENIVAHIKPDGAFILQLPKRRMPKGTFSESRRFGDDYLHILWI